MNSCLVKFDQASIHYPGKVTFDNINFEIKKHQHFALIGENTRFINALLDAIAGKAIISKGKLHYFFCESNNPPHANIAYLPVQSQNRNTSSYYQQRYNSPGPEQYVTVENHLSAIRPLKSHGLWTLVNVIDKLNLATLLDKNIIGLSNGEMQRLRIGAALLRNPVLLIMQNPFAGLDEKMRQQTKDLIKEITQSGITVIVSCYADEIPDSINNIAIFHNNNSISLLPGENFHYKAPTAKTPDEEKIKALVAGQPLQKFETVIEMKNVVIQYDNKLILNHINWKVKQGERWALSGPNGAGKTTLISLITGDNPQAFANNIVLFDRKKGSGESIWDIKKKIGYFSAELYRHFPVHLTCGAAVESGYYDTIGLFRKSSPQKRDAALSWLEIFKIEHLAETALRNVTPGEKRMCLLARAFIKNAPLLILDEPCEGLTESEKLYTKSLIDTICRFSNTTLIYVSHYKDDIPESITHYIALQKGVKVSNS